VAHGRLLRQLIKAGANGTGEEFRAVAQKVIEEEREKNHHLLANDLERILYGEPNDRSRSQLTKDLPPIPTDRERNLPLLQANAPVRNFEDIVLSEPNQKVLQNVLLEQGRRDLLQSWGLRPISRLLFVGPPGCGKTLAGEVLATELGLPLVLIRFDAVVSSFLGETAANLRKVFDYIDAGRYVALFDEFDAIAKEREDVTEHGELRRVVSAFLQMMDNFRGSSILVAASNHEGMLDRALWRRFDEVLVFDRPEKKLIQELLQVKLRGVRRDFEPDDEEILAGLFGLAHADIERVLIRAIKAMALGGREFLTRDILREALAREEKRRALADQWNSRGQ
jgi:SpoVK/Ycf46/Vps4 family AAA+-type ATPase